MISIITVDYHGKEFKDILIKSVEDNTVGEYEILIHDNGIRNVGHGPGLDELVKDAKGKYILALDIDSHILLKGWDKELVDYFTNRRSAGLKLIAGQGGQLKPIRPCVAFFERDYFLKNNMSFEPKNLDGAKFDVGIQFYFHVLSLGGKVEFFNYEPPSYKNTRGNNYKFLNKSFVYHHWYGTRWFRQDGSRGRKEIDGIIFEDFNKSKQSLIKQFYG